MKIRVWFTNVTNEPRPVNVSTPLSADREGPNYRSLVIEIPDSAVERLFQEETTQGEVCDE